MISRRQFLRTALIGSAAAGISFVGYDLRNDGYTSDFILEHVTFQIPGLPPAFDGYTIGFLTDLHLSTWVPESWIVRALEELTRQNVDLLLLGGDYILVNEISLWDQFGLNRSPQFANLPKKVAIPRIYETFANIVSRFSFRDGMLAVVGNHDHWNMFPVFQETLKSFPAIRIMINEEISLRRGEQELCIFGVDDFLTGIPSAPPKRELRDERAKRIILSHNPDYLTALLEHPEHEFSVALCGHTHGGQIVLPGVGPIAAQVMDRRFVSGAAHMPDGKVVYTSRGLGVVGLPFRVGCPAEVTVCTLAKV